MTREEARQILAGMYCLNIDGDEDYCANRNSAIDLAIEALKREEKFLHELEHNIPADDRPKVIYVCDGRACDAECNGEYGQCFKTSKVEHAKNFERIAGTYYEKERTGEWSEVTVDDDESVWTRHRFYCSACGRWNTYGKADYCPRCGAKMLNTED